MAAAAENGVDGRGGGKTAARPGTYSSNSPLVDRARPVRGRVDVLALEQPVLDRYDVDAVPLEAAAVARRGRRPLAHDEAVANVEPPLAEREIRRVAEDRGDVLSRRLALGPLAERVVLEHEVRRVQRADRVDVVLVPGAVVPLDQLPLVHLRAALLSTR